MTKEKITPNTSSRDVLPAMASVLGRYDKDHFTGAPGVIQEMMEDVLCSPAANDAAYRERIVMTLRLIRDFGHALEPFPQEIIWQAANP